MNSKKKPAKNKFNEADLVPLSEVWRTIRQVLKSDTFPKDEFIKMMIKSAIRGVVTGLSSGASGIWLNAAQQDLTHGGTLRNPKVFIFGGLEQLAYFANSMLQLSINKDRRAFNLKVESRLKEFAQKLYLQMDAEYRVHKSSSDFTQDAGRAARAISNMIESCLQLANATGGLGTSGGILFAINPLIFSALAVWGIINVAWTNNYFIHMNPKWRKREERLKKSNERTGNITGNVSVVQRTGSDKRYQEIIGLEKEKTRKQKDMLDKGIMRFWMKNNAIDTAVYIATVAGVFFKARTGNIDVGTIRMFIGSAGGFMDKMSGLANINTDVKESIFNYNDAMKSLMTRPKIVNKLDAIELDQEKFKRKPPTIEFKNVTHHYLDKDGKPGKNIFKNFSLTIKGGEQVALLGESGSGKTTILSLLVREFEQQSGDIWINGHRNDQITLASLRKIVRFVPQSEGYLDSSVRENMRMTKLDATDKEIQLALARAKISRAVKDKKGLDTVMGQGNGVFSGGERHRIGLARAFVATAPVMIFDEPTGALDINTSKEIIESIKRATRGKTTIVVTHNPIDALEFDRVIVMKRGKIVDDGHPADLQKSGGEFSKMLDRAVGKIIGHLNVINKSRGKIK